MAFVESLSTFLRDFGIAAEVDGNAVTALFDQPHDEDFAGLTSTRPQIGLPTADAGDVATGSSVRIGTQLYRVAAVVPDGTGWTVLKLQEAAA